MNTPNIRFKGFSGDWEQRKLGDVVGNVIGGGTPKTSIDNIGTVIYHGFNLQMYKKTKCLILIFQKVLPS